MNKCLEKYLNMNKEDRARAWETFLKDVHGPDWSLSNFRLKQNPSEWIDEE